MKYRLEQEIEQDSEYILTFNFNQTLLNKPYNLFAIEYLMKQCQFHLCTEYRKFVAVTLEQAASFRGGISYIDQELLMKDISRNL
ncbi:hypothetical protein NEOLI_005272 [Neolecta irregularis DAH-3]|uniref:Uncharacterized protein n=1 Tax=Neolecta irregularis (strain DAH-3) TaxID=1198029 RepID=A0A1U7LRN0_NEOID|nr:hypothetical protein NEOLI_005272 [Neolecta irregularis DAH-3]|eukprot:OLL25330.1 hypothetical protein NEOLI_005272 [Neolecta irregularis DAH-3]